MMLFGYAVFTLVVVTVWATGFWLVKSGIKRRSILMTVFGGTIIIWVTLFAIRMVVFELLDLNPLIASDSAIIGTWSNADEKIELHADHRFRYTRDGETIEGTWQRDDFNLRIMPSEHLMEFIQFQGEYRLLTHPPEDFDVWDYDLGLEKVSK